MTADTRYLTFIAVGRLWAQIGTNTASTSAPVMSDTGFCPSVGRA